MRRRLATSLSSIRSSLRKGSPADVFSRGCSRSYSSSSSSSSSPSTDTNANTNTTATLVLLRHGQSTWNETPPIFTGWCDPPLTPRGLAESTEAGRLLKRRGLVHFDRVFTSTLQRAVMTCELVLEASINQGEQPMVMAKAWQLNERHYGALQGRDKSDPGLLEKHGQEQMVSWRRDFHARPPPLDETHAHYQPPPAPRTESLQDCQNRVLEYWYSTCTILPLAPGSQNLLVAHANTIRALVSYLDKVPHDMIPKVNIPNSVPCIYQLDATTGRAISPVVLDSQAGGTRGQWLFSAENYTRLKEKIGGTSGSFVRSIFEAWDTDHNGLLSQHEVCRGLREIMNDNESDDSALAALAAKILEQVDVNGSETIDLQEFDEFAVAAFEKFVPALVE